MSHSGRSKLSSRPDDSHPGPSSRPGTQRTEQTAARRRKSTASTKRRTIAESDEEEYVDSESAVPSRKVKRPRAAENSDLEVDVDGVEENDRDLNLSHDSKTASKQTKNQNITRKPATARSRTSRTIISSSEDADFDDTPLEAPGDDGDDDFIEPEKQRQKPGTSASGKSKATAKGQGKGKITIPGASKGVGAKGKGKAGKEKEAKGITMKDERKVQPAPLERDAPPPDDVGQASGPPAPVEAVKEVTPPPKKRKLPPIRKNKPPAQNDAPTETTQDAPPQPAKPPAAPPKVAEAANPILPPIRKSSATAAAELDLRNPTLYAELFRNSGGGTPRSGLNRREKDMERRKELDRMRDEVRAKRDEEAKHSFNLQAQADRIARFERKLREERSSALYPNFLAASFKDEMERQKRRESRKKEEKEEGEMT